MINNSTMYTGKDLREGLGRIFSLLGILQRPQSKEKKKAFNNQYTEIVAEKDKNKLSYLYQFIKKTNKTCEKCKLLSELYEKTPKSNRDYWLVIKEHPVYLMGIEQLKNGLKKMEEEDED